jgi:signal transduction histidine kinase
MLRFATGADPQGGELDVLRIQAATLADALSVHEEQAARQFEIIRAQRRDLEDRTRALQHALDELGQSQVALVRAERMAVLGQLAASVGHELRNPLAAIRNGNTYIAKRLRRDAADDRMIAFTQLIERELDACTRIIGDLLDFARERALILAPTPLHALVAEAIALVPASKSQLHSEVSSELPLALIDRQQFRQVLLNLIQNAVDAMEPGGGGTIRVSAERTGDTWWLRIEDDGPGMPPEVAARVFEPLFTTKVKGTGLGLAIVWGIVSRHRGTIQVDSAVGRGTRFVIHWPSEIEATTDPAIDPVSHHEPQEGKAACPT